jgi:hypothetical protein
MGRKTGHSNLKKKILFEAIEDHWPASKSGWKHVAEQYKEDSFESLTRDPTDLKRYFHEVMCAKFKKVSLESAMSWLLILIVSILC